MNGANLSGAGALAALAAKSDKEKTD